MNTDIDPLSRWLDGHATEAQTDALVRAVEEDPAALQSLVEVSLMEAGLRLHLQECEATARPLSLPPVWHWKRAGRWMAAAGSLAAAVVAAWLFLSPPGNGGAPDAALADATAGKMKIRRVPAGSGERAKIPGGSVHPGNVPPMSPLVERTYRPSAEVRGMLEEDPEVGWLKPGGERPWGRYAPGTVQEAPPGRPDNVEYLTRTGALHSVLKYGYPGPLKVAPISELPLFLRDARLARFLRGSGVEFPEGASARFQDVGEVSLTLTETGHAEAARVLASHAEVPYPGVTLAAGYFNIDTPESLRRDCVLSAEVLRADPPLGGVFRHAEGDNERAYHYQYQGPDSAMRTVRIWPEMQCRLRLVCRMPPTLGSFTAPARMGIASEVPISCSLWRVGGSYLLRGVVGIPLAEENKPLAGVSEIEFELTLSDGEYAVIHLDEVPAPLPDLGKHFVMIGIRAPASGSASPPARSGAIPPPAYIPPAPAQQPSTPEPSPQPPPELSHEQLIDQWLARQRDANLLRDRPMEATIRSKAGTVSCEVHRTAEGIEIRLPQGPMLAFSTATRKWVRKDEAGREIPGSDLIPGTDLACEELVPATWPWLHWTKRTLRGEEHVKTRKCSVFDLKAPDDAGPFGTVRLWATQERKGRVIRSLDPFMKMYGYDRSGKRIHEVAVKSLMRAGEAIVPREVTFYTYAPGSSKRVSETTVTWNALPVPEAR